MPFSQVLGFAQETTPSSWQYASNSAEYFDKALQLVNKFHDKGRVQVSIAPHAPYTVSDEQLECKCVSVWICAGVYA